MERYSLREAAERTSRSITTLRRYIRSKRLKAEKRSGRYGPEYFVSEQDLRDAGLFGEADEAPRADPPRSALARPFERALREALPLTLYQELQMKHEQLLVQYGMVRATGLRTMELQGEVEARRRETEALKQEVAALRTRLSRESAGLRQRLREAELEIADRDLKIAALEEKSRALEMLTRNAVTNETIERQFSAVMEQTRRVERLAALPDGRSRSAPLRPGPGDRAGEPEH